MSGSREDKKLGSLLAATGSGYSERNLPGKATVPFRVLNAAATETRAKSKFASATKTKPECFVFSASGTAERVVDLSTLICAGCLHTNGGDRPVEGDGSGRLLCLGRFCVGWTSQKAMSSASRRAKFNGALYANAGAAGRATAVGCATNWAFAEGRFESMKLLASKDLHSQHGPRDYIGPSLTKRLCEQRQARVRDSRKPIISNWAAEGGSVVACKQATLSTDEVVSNRCARTDVPIGSVCAIE